MSGEPLTIVVKDIKYKPLADENEAIRVGSNDVSDQGDVPSNIFIGHGAGLAHNTNFANAIFVGKNAGAKVSSNGATGKGGVFIGVNAGSNSTGTNSNTFVGDSTGTYNTSGAQNSFFGSSAGYNNTTGMGNTFVGFQAGYNNSVGDQNTFVGEYAGLNFSSPSNSNIAIGFNSQVYSGNLQFGGDYNIILGCGSYLGADYDVPEGGDNNIIVGTQSLCSGSPTNNVILGNNTRVNGTNVLSIGNGLLTGASNIISIGSYNATKMYIGVGGDNNNTIQQPQLSDVYFAANSTFNNTAGSGGNPTVTLHNCKFTTPPSDARLKSEITENVKGLEFISKLRPVTYTIAGRKSMGLIAQEVEETVKELSYDSFEGVDAPSETREYYGLDYEKFITPLLKAVQELSAKVDAQAQEITELKSKLSA